MLAVGYTNKSDAEKIALLLTIGGDELIEIYNSLEFPEPEPNANADITVGAVIERFNEYFSPRSNELTTRYKFRKCVQRTGERLDAFITRLKIIMKECDYGDEKDKQLRDQIVFGCREDSLRDKFFREAALTLQMTIHICTAHQASQKQMNSFREDRDETVAKIRETKPADRQRKYKSENTQIRECKFCGRISESMCGTNISAQRMEKLVPSVVVTIILLRNAEQTSQRQCNHINMCMPFTKKDTMNKSTF